VFFRSCVVNVGLFHLICLLVEPLLKFDAGDQLLILIKLIRDFILNNCTSYFIVFICLFCFIKSMQ